MDGLTELIPFLIEEGNDQLWKDYLKTCTELKIFVKKPNESVPSINSLLNEPKSRLYGLRLLDVFITQCPKSIINDQFVNWFNQCLKGIGQSSSVEQSVVSFKVLSSLVKLSIEFPDVRKQTSQVFIPKVLDVVVDKLNDDSGLRCVILQCLHSCLLHYSKSCGNHRNGLEKVLIKVLTHDKTVTGLASKCFHLLAQTGAPGAESVNYKENWRSQHLIIVNTLHFVLDKLFSDVDEILGSYDECLTEKRKLAVLDVCEDVPLLKSQKWSHTFRYLCQILNSMLLDSFPTRKRIHPEAIFGVVCRTLAVSCKSLESKISNSTYSIMCNIPDIHLSVIGLLNSMMATSRTNLLPFSALVSKVFTQIFKLTEVDDWIEGREKPFSSVRKAGYKCLSTWLAIGKSSCFVDTQVVVIVEAILKDIKCENKIVSLNMEQKKRGKGSKKVPVIDSNDVPETNSEVSRAALACLPLLLRTTLSLSSVKKLQEVVVKLLFEIQRNLRCDHRLPPPYSNVECRVELYRALTALCVSPHPEFPPPLHYANVLLNSSMTDSDIKVQRVGSHGVNCISHLIRPCAPSFDFTSELDSEIIPINPYPETLEKEVSVSSGSSVNNFTDKPRYKNKDNIRNSNVKRSKYKNGDNSQEVIILKETNNDFENEEIQVIKDDSDNEDLSVTSPSKLNSNEEDISIVECENVVDARLTSNKEEIIDVDVEKEPSGQTNEIIVIDSHDKEEINVLDEESAAREYHSKNNSENQLNQTSKIIDLDVSTTSRRTRSCLPIVVETVVLDEFTDKNVSDAPVETRISEDITIIEKSPTQSPSRRSKRGLKNSVGSNSELPVVSGDITIVSDNDEPTSKRSRSNRRKCDEKNGDIHETDDEVDMLSSFVDSVDG